MEKIIYKEVYKNPYLEIRSKDKPKLNHINDGFECAEAKIIEAGLIEKNGEEFEYQDIRVYIKSP